MEGIPVTVPVVLQTAPFGTFTSAPSVRGVETHPYRPWVLLTDDVGVTVFALDGLVRGPQAAVGVDSSDSDSGMFGGGYRAEVVARVGLGGVLSARRTVRRRRLGGCASASSDLVEGSLCVPDGVRGEVSESTDAVSGEVGSAVASAEASARSQRLRSSMRPPQSSRLGAGLGQILDTRVAAPGCPSTRAVSGPEEMDVDAEGWGLPEAQSCGRVVASGFWPGCDAWLRPWLEGSGSHLPESVWVLYSKALVVWNVLHNDGVIVPLSGIPQPAATPARGRVNASPIEPTCACTIGPGGLAIGTSSGAICILRIRAGAPATVVQVLWPPASSGAVDSIVEMPHHKSLEGIVASYKRSNVAAWARLKEANALEIGPKEHMQEDLGDGVSGGLAPLASVLVGRAEGGNVRGDATGIGESLVTFPGGHVTLSMSGSHIVGIGSKGHVCVIGPCVGVASSGHPVIGEEPVVTELTLPRGAVPVCGSVFDLGTPSIPKVVLVGCADGRVYAVHKGRTDLCFDLASLLPEKPAKMRLSAVVVDVDRPGLVWVSSGAGCVGVRVGCRLGVDVCRLEGGDEVLRWNADAGLEVVVEKDGVEKVLVATASPRADFVHCLASYGRVVASSTWRVGESGGVRRCFVGVEWPAMQLAALGVLEVHAARAEWIRVCDTFEATSVALPREVGVDDDGFHRVGAVFVRPGKAAIVPEAPKRRMTLFGRRPEPAPEPKPAVPASLGVFFVNDKPSTSPAIALSFPYPPVRVQGGPFLSLTVHRGGRETLVLSPFPTDTDPKIVPAGTSLPPPLTCIWNSDGSRLALVYDHGLHLWSTSSTDAVLHPVGFEARLSPVHEAMWLPHPQNTPKSEHVLLLRSSSTLHAVFVSPNSHLHLTLATLHRLAYASSALLSTKTPQLLTSADLRPHPLPPTPLPFLSFPDSLPSAPQIRALQAAAAQNLPQTLSLLSALPPTTLPHVLQLILQLFPNPALVLAAPQDIPKHKKAQLLVNIATNFPKRLPPDLLTEALEKLGVPLL